MKRKEFNYLKRISGLSCVIWITVLFLTMFMMMILKCVVPLMICVVVLPFFVIS